MKLEWYENSADCYDPASFAGGLCLDCAVLYGVRWEESFVKFYIYTNTGGEVAVECHPARLLKDPPTYTAASYEEAQALVPTVGMALLKLKGLI